MADWLKPYPWTIYVTLTFSKDIVSLESAIKLFKQWVKELGESVIYARTIEWHNSRDCLHIHAIIGNVTKKAVWKHGISKIQPYNPILGARYYIGKFCLSEQADLDYKLY